MNSSFQLSDEKDRGQRPVKSSGFRVRESRGQKDRSHLLKSMSSGTFLDLHESCLCRASLRLPFRGRPSASVLDRTRNSVGSSARISN